MVPMYTFGFETVVAHLPFRGILISFSGNIACELGNVHNSSVNGGETECMDARGSRSFVTSNFSICGLPWSIKAQRAYDMPPAEDIL